MKPNANPFRGVVLLICVLALIFCATSIFRTTTHQTTYSYADIRDLFQQEKVETVQVDEDTLTLTLKEPVNGNNVVTYSIYSFQLFYDDFNDIVVQQYEDGIISDYNYPDSPSPAWMSTILTWVIILVVMSLLMYFLFFRRAQGGGGGGGGARRGAGETKLELDRRHVHARIDALAEKLAEMEKRRGESRKARAKTGMPVVSLVGYTNVGKSSLMNALCGPSVAEADMLFATLDPTSRKLVLPSGMAVLLVDTVGFVSRLPHNLVEAFKSTLEEAAWSDVIVRVADAGDDQREEQLAVTDEVLDGLDCADIPRLTVYNKCDKPNALNFDPDILLTSAKTGYGLDALLKKLDELLSDRVHTIRVLLPYDKLGLAAPMRERGSVQLEEYREDGLYLEGIVKTEDLHCFEGYLV